MARLSHKVTSLPVHFNVDTFTGNGVTTTFTLTEAPSYALAVTVYQSGIYQNRSEYSVVGSDLIFTEAPENGVTIEVLVYTGPSVTLRDNTITSAKLSGDLVTPGNLSVTGDTDTVNLLVTGALTLNTTTTSTSKTLINGEQCAVTTAAQTITLPATPSIGDNVTVFVGNFTDTIIAGNGSNIMALAEDFTIDSANVGITFVYTDATYGWRIK